MNKVSKKNSNKISSKTDNDNKTNKKLISFIIPCYNSSKYMKKCIDSIRELGEEIEILIIDDGASNDNT